MPKKSIDEQPGKEKNVKTDSVKCSGCGSNMVFDPETQKLYCPHCGNTVEFASEEIARELQLTFSITGDSQWKKDESVVFRCNNCGAKVVLKNGETAKNCPFCGTAHVEKVEELAGLRPNALIPFNFGIDKALEFTKKWAKKRFFAPRKFKKNLTTENVNGVYMPSFTFDSHTYSEYKARIGRTHTHVVGSGKNKHVQTYIVWKDVSGTYFDAFDDILITAGSKFNQKQMSKLSPFYTNDSKRFNQNYMLGFSAYRYDRDLSECWQEAKCKMDAEIQRRILSKYVYDQLSYINVSTTHRDTTYKYVMIPVYLGNFNYNKKLYNFYMNGFTGRIVGKTPKSPLKILFTVLGLLGVVVLGIVISYLNLGL